MNYEMWNEYELHPAVAQEFENEMYEAEMAHQLLNVQNEAELNHFLGGIVSLGLRGARALYNSPAGQAIKNRLITEAKSLARRALPNLAGRVGGYLGGTAGAQLGQRLGSWAANRYFNEYEADLEYEAELSTARKLVRVVRVSSNLIAQRAQSGQPINSRSVKRLIMQVARQYFPELSGKALVGELEEDASASGDAPEQGTWYRRGNQIIITGVG